MPCETIKMPNGGVAIICSRGVRRAKACRYCGKPSAVLCDFPIVPKGNGKRKKDCDVPMCLSCTQKGVSREVDFCKEHFPKAKAAYERRLQNQKEQDNARITN